MANPASKASQDLAGAPGSTAAPASAQHPADLAALTARDDFLLELGEVLGGQASVHPAESIETAIGQLTHARHKRLLVIDARDTGDVRANIERAAAAIPGAVILVFAEAETEKEIATALKGTQVFAVLPVPVEHAKTAAVLEAALGDAAHSSAEHYRSAVGAEPAAATSAAMRLQRPLRPEASVEPDEPSRGWMLWAGLGALVLAAGGATWYLMHREAHAPLAAPARATAAPVTRHAPPAPQPAVDTSIVQGRVDDLLDRARRAMFERHFTTPKGANALVYYRSVLAVDPTNGEALDGLRRVGNVLTSRFHDAMSRSQFTAAALALATLKVARPTDPHIAAFQRELYVGEISQALAGDHPTQAAALLAQATQAGVPAAQLSSLQARLSKLQQSQQTQSLAAQLANSIRMGEFTGPGGAEADLAQLRTFAPAAAATQQAEQTLIAALLDKARQDALAGNTTDESRWLAAAQANGASAGDVAAFQQRLATEQASAARAKVAELLARAQARIRSGKLTSPDADSAAYYLRAVEDAHPSGTELAAAQRARGELAAKLLARAQSEALAGHAAAAQADVAQARRWGATAAEVGSVTGSIRVALHQASQPTAADLERLAAQLVRVRYEPPSYPNHALENRITGQVTVQYVVDTQGVPRDVRVLSAQPANVFDRAALDAIRSWRYKPVKFRGRPVAVPVRTLIRFVLPN